MLDGMRFVGEARLTLGGGDLATAGYEVSTGGITAPTLVTGGTHTQLTIPAQCKTFQLIVGQDVQGSVQLDTRTQRMRTWCYPIINGGLSLDTPQHETFQFTSTSPALATLYGVQDIIVSSNPHAVGIYAAGSAITVDVGVAFEMSIGGTGFVHIDNLSASIRCYIQYV